MFTNAPTLRCITYMHCHVDGVSLQVFFFSKKYFNRKFPIFSKKIFLSHFFSNSTSFSYLLYTLNPLPIRFPSCFTLSILFQFVIPIYIFFYIKGTIVEKLDLNFLRELFWSFGVLQPNLWNPTWIHREKSSPLQTCKCFIFLFFFKEEKDLLFSNTCQPSSFAEMNLIN